MAHFIIHWIVCSVRYTMLNLNCSVWYVTEDFSEDGHEWSKHAQRIQTYNNFAHCNGIKDFVKSDISAWFENITICKSMSLSKLAIFNQATHIITHKD